MQNYKTLLECSLEEVIPFIPDNDNVRVRQAFGEYKVKVSSQRLILFKKNPCCVCCGIRGTKMLLQIDDTQVSPHFNLYAETPEGLELMTKDHIIPKSKGGRDELSNYQTMCIRCNNFKGSMDISIEHLRELISISENGEPLSSMIDMIKNFLHTNGIVPDGDRITSLLKNAKVIDNETI